MSEHILTLRPVFVVEDEVELARCKLAFSVFQKSVVSYIILKDENNEDDDDITPWEKKERQEEEEEEDAFAHCPPDELCA